MQLFPVLTSILVLSSNSINYLRTTFSVILIVSVGVYLILTHENSQYDEDDDDLDESTPETAKWVNNEEIRILRKYLRFPTVSLSTNFGILSKINHLIKNEIKNEKSFICRKMCKFSEETSR